MNFLFDHLSMRVNTKLIKHLNGVHAYRRRCKLPVQLGCSTKRNIRNECAILIKRVKGILREECGYTASSVLPLRHRRLIHAYIYIYICVYMRVCIYILCTFITVDHDENHGRLVATPNEFFKLIYLVIIYSS